VFTFTIGNNPGSPKMSIKNCVFACVYVFVNDAVFNTVAIKENGKGIVDVDGVHTNIVMMKMVKPGLTPADFCSRLAQVKCCVMLFNVIYTHVHWFNGHPPVNLG